MSKITSVLFALFVAFGLSGCVSFSMDLGGSKDRQTPVYYPHPPTPYPYYY